jgi:hypothetical protein
MPKKKIKQSTKYKNPGVNNHISQGEGKKKQEKYASRRYLFTCH